jgi:hypothetical protein
MTTAARTLPAPRLARSLRTAGIIAFALLGLLAVHTGTANAIANGEPFATAISGSRSS